MFSVKIFGEVEAGGGETINEPFAVPEPYRVLNWFVQVTCTRIAELMTYVRILITCYKKDTLVRPSIHCRLDLPVQCVRELVQAGTFCPREIVVVEGEVPCVRNRIAAFIGLIEKWNVGVHV